MAIAVQSTWSSDAHTSSEDRTHLDDVVVASGASTIVVVLTTRDLGDRPAVSMTRGAQSFTRAVLQNATGGNRTCVEVWWLDSPAVGTATIDALHNEAIGFVGIGAAVLTGAASGGPADTDGTSATGANPAVSLAAPAGGFAIAGGAWDVSGVVSVSDTELYGYASDRSRRGQYAAGLAAGAKTLQFTKASANYSVAGAVFAAAAAPAASGLAIAGGQRAPIHLADGREAPIYLADGTSL